VEGSDWTRIRHTVSFILLELSHQLLDQDVLVTWLISSPNLVQLPFVSWVMEVSLLVVLVLVDGRQVSM